MADAWTHVYVYEFGEAYDDLRAAFYIDERAYDDLGLAQTAKEVADAAMRESGVIYSIEISGGRHAVVPRGLPTWEEFRQRHFIEGMPLPVRARPQKVRVPFSWEQMNEAMGKAHNDFRDELVTTFSQAFPSGKVVIRNDYGPQRRSPASVDWSEESYGFELLLRIQAGPDSPTRAAGALQDSGWAVDNVTSNELTAERNGYDLWITATSQHLDIEARSPLYRAAEPNFVVEPRNPD